VSRLRLAVISLVGLSGFVFFALSSVEAASVFPREGFADASEDPVPNIEVKDADGNRFLFQDRFKDVPGPLVVLPIFTRCKGACPALAQALRVASRQIASEVSDTTFIIFSFDPSDTAEQLLSFKTNLRLPDEWVLITSENESSKRFFDSLRYSYRDEDGDFIHPNQFFVLDAQAVWAATVIGTDFQAQHLQEALELARGEMSFLEHFIRYPEQLAILAGIVFFVICLGLAIYVPMRFRHSAKEKPQSEPAETKNFVSRN
jgi:cytochrome oxidase Cu insertion factor (SCO1/SenC/PrrC family)